MLQRLYDSHVNLSSSFLKAPQVAGFVHRGGTSKTIDRSKERKMGRILKNPSFVKFELGFPCLMSRASSLWCPKKSHVRPSCGGVPKTFFLTKSRTGQKIRKTSRALVQRRCLMLLACGMHPGQGHICLATHAIVLVLVTRLGCNMWG